MRMMEEDRKRKRRDEQDNNFKTPERRTRSVRSPDAKASEREPKQPTPRISKTAKKTKMLQASLEERHKSDLAPGQPENNQGDCFRYGTLRLARQLGGEEAHAQDSFPLAYLICVSGPGR